MKLNFVRCAFLLAFGLAGSAAVADAPIVQSADHPAPCIPIDRNMDGYLNVLDSVLSESDMAEIPPIDRFGLSAAVITGTLQSPAFVRAGDTFRALLLVSGSELMVGYTLHVIVTPVDGGEGTLVAASMTSSFAPSRNIFVATGIPLDPFFSVIETVEDGSLVINALSENLAAAGPVSGVSDALAMVEFVVQDKASGRFELRLGGATALSDPNGFGIPFAFDPVEFEVLPSPCSGADLAEPFEVLDLADLVAFVTLFTAGDLSVDYSEPNGLLDLSDIVVFIQFFLSGC